MIFKLIKLNIPKNDKGKSKPVYKKSNFSQKNILYFLDMIFLKYVLNNSVLPLVHLACLFLKDIKLTG